MMQAPKVKIIEKSKKQRILQSAANMKADRQPHEDGWREAASVTLPYAPEFLTSDSYRGDRLDNDILDSTPTFAAQTLSAGMMAGITSPAREWFLLNVNDPTVNENYYVKEWCDIVSDRMRTVFLQSNIYESCPNIYEELGVFGQAPMLVERDPDTVIYTETFPIGSYWIGQDHKKRVNRFYREYQDTVANVIDDFARDRRTNEINWDVLSDNIREEYEANHLETKVEIGHMIYPNEDYRPGSALSRNKRFSSCYFELGQGGNDVSGRYAGDYEDDLFLRESGYDLFPILCPRWSTSGKSPYARTYPGRTALGDARQLQHGESRKGQAIDVMVHPPTIGPSQMKRIKIGALGEMTYFDEPANMAGARALYQINPQLGELKELQEEVRQRIKRVYFEDLFLMMMESDRRQITAEEIRVRQQEKLLRVGPVLEQLNKSFLDPLIEITFHHMEAAGLIPPAPEQLMGQGITVKYVSIMAQAQKAIGVSGYQEFSSFILNLSQVYPQIFDTVNVDEMADQVNTALGLSSKVINPPEKVAAIRQQRDQQMKAQAMSEQLAAGAGAAKDLSGASLEGNSALSELVNQAKAGQLAGR